MAVFFFPSLLRSPVENLSVRGPPLQPSSGLYFAAQTPEELRGALNYSATSVSSPLFAHVLNTLGGGGGRSEESKSCIFLISMEFNDAPPQSQKNVDQNRSGKYFRTIAVSRCSNLSLVKVKPVKVKSALVADFCERGSSGVRLLGG